MRIFQSLLAATTFIIASPPAWASCDRCKINSSETLNPTMPLNLDSLAKFKSTGQLFNYSPATNLFNVMGGNSVAYASPFSFKVGGTTTSTLYDLGAAVPEPAA